MRPWLLGIHTWMPGNKQVPRSFLLLTVCLFMPGDLSAVGWIFVTCPKFMSTRTSNCNHSGVSADGLQGNSPKMRWSWIRVDLKYKNSCHEHRGGKKKMCKDRQTSERWNFQLERARRKRDQEKAESRFFSEPPEKTKAHFHLDLGLLASRIVTKQVWVVSRHLAHDSNFVHLP